MKFYFKAIMFIGTLLLGHSAYAHEGEVHSDDLFFVPSVPPKPVITSVPANSSLPPLLTFSPLMSSVSLESNEVENIFYIDDLLHPINFITTANITTPNVLNISGGTNVSEPFAMISVMGAMLGFMMIRHKKES